jgi:hypothetical protein
LQRLVRSEWEHQKHFPLTVATKLSQQFASHGLQFFKVDKTVTHVAVARPQYLDLETTPVSENIKRIVEFINGNTKCSRKKLLEALAPAPRATVIEINPEAPAAAPAAAASPEPTQEQTAVVSDLHWLVHQGHVLEFADGRLETAKKPAPRPPKPPKKPVEGAVTGAKVEATAPEIGVTAEAAPAIETTAKVENIVEPVSAPVETVPAAEAAPAAPDPAHQIASEPPVS